MFQIQAHRGASAVRPENTMSAFYEAERLGADAIELDVHLLFDGTLVVHHDRDLGRCEAPTDSIYEYRSSNIKSFSVGEKFDSSYQKEVIPLFEEVLQFLQRNQLILNVEIKNDFGFITDVSGAVIHMLEEYHMKDRCIISSFDHHVLQDIKQKYPAYKVGILYASTFGIDIVDYAKQYHFDALHPCFTTVTKALVEKAHQNGIAVNTWTVNTAENVKRMKECGVDSVISNEVEMALSFR